MLLGPETSGSYTAFKCFAGISQDLTKGHLLHASGWRFEIDLLTASDVIVLKGKHSKIAVYNVRHRQEPITLCARKFDAQVE